MIKSYKGFNKDMTCHGKKYEEGKDYEEPKANVCVCGMHACEYPLSVFDYYPPATSVYHEVTQDGELSRAKDGSKIASTRMHIGARLSICGIVDAAIEYTKSRTTSEHTDPIMATAGFKGAATAGDAGVAIAGFNGVATVGDSGAANAGDAGAAIAGDYGSATAGLKGVATAGDYGVANAGDAGAAIAGNYGSAISRGQSASGENGLSVARGNGCRVKGGLGAILMIAEEECNCCDIVAWKVVVVDGETIKPNTWYELKSGELVECETDESEECETNELEIKYVR